MVVLEGTTLTATTTAIGAFQLPSVMPGPYTLVASGIGWVTARVSVLVTAGEVTSVDLVLTPAPGAGGVPLTGAERLPAVVVTATRPSGPVTSLPPVSETFVYSGKKTEVLHLGASVGRGRGVVTLEWSSVTKQFTDANNTVFSPDATVGVIPAYGVLDLSAEYPLAPKAVLNLGVNNVGNSRYFTMRTTEYPGPDIIPALGRSAYITLRVEP